MGIRLILLFKPFVVFFRSFFFFLASVHFFNMSCSLDYFQMWVGSWVSYPQNVLIL